MIRYANLKLRARLLAGDEPRWLQHHPRRAYIAQCLMATPGWVNLGEMRRLDRRARELTALTGKLHVVDHVIPLTNKLVCGLNVQGNLQVVLAQINARKSNRWCEWHGELFSEPEQFTLRFA